MSNSDINRIELITPSDTLSQFMEKCNNNFSTLFEYGGGPTGAKGDEGDPGAPTKPKVPIHTWRLGVEYEYEDEASNHIYGIKEDLTDVKYQSGHLIMLKNGHVYILKANDEDNFNLKPEFALALQTFNPDDIIDGKSAYVHIAYANSPDGSVDFITDYEIKGGTTNSESSTTFSLRRSGGYSTNDRSYMGIYTSNEQTPSKNESVYTWMRIQGNEGIGIKGEKGDKGDQGPKGDKGDKGDGYTGHLYTIDLEGDMSTISIDIDRTRLYDDSNDYCECIAHAYYGSENVKLNLSDVTINLPKEYMYLGNDIVLVSDNNSKVGKIEKTQRENDVIIKFIPDKNFIFPKGNIIFSIHVDAEINDKYDKNIYNFTRDVVWTIKGIVSTFELEIQPKYRTIKLFEDGKYYPEVLLVDVYKIEDAIRSPFDFSKNPSFKLLYKEFNSNKWEVYPKNGVNTKDVSCLEFQVVRNYDSTDPESTDIEIWDYEDVWVVSDGKGTHYYHADLGSTESMMVLTTGEKDIENENCAEMKNKSGYSIVFNPKFFDGTDELNVVDVKIGSINGEEYRANGTFAYNFENSTEEIDGIDVYKSSTLTITKVPYGVEVIPMTFNVYADCPIYDSFGEFVEYIRKIDTVSFNVYISTLSNTYSLSPTVSAYNTSMGKNGDTIGCDVYKNSTLIPFSELNQNGLTLKYIVRSGGTDPKQPIVYTEPLVYGHDDDIVKDEFSADDVAIEFILYYGNKEVVKSTVPLIKDGIDGRDGDTWQYIFCRSSKYPFEKTGISDPSKWINDINKDDPNSEYMGNEEDDYTDNIDLQWYDDHKGVNDTFIYEYQSYRKWDKDNKVWGAYGEPTLYSNYSKNGSGYSVMLSNPIAVIPVGDRENDWAVEENLKNQSDSTLVYLYNNTSDISKNSNIKISIPDNIHFKNLTENGVNKITFTPVVNGVAFDFGSNAQYKLPITLTYSLGEDIDNDNIEDAFTSTIYWTLSPIKGLQDIEVFVDKRIVNTTYTSTHTLKVGYYIITSNGSKKFIGNYNDSGNTNKYKIAITDDIAQLTSNIVSNWENTTFDFVKNGENRNCFVVLVDGSTIIDYINITSINDGKSAIHLELTQDYISLPCSADGGSVHPDYDVNENPIYFQMKLYNGIELIEDYSNISYEFKVDGEKILGFTPDGEGGFDIPTDIITGDMNIECIATYKGASAHKTLFIDLENTPYELEISKNVLTRDVNVNQIIDKTLIVRVKYWMGGNWIYTDKGVVIANTAEGKEHIPFGSPSGKYNDRILVIEESSLKNNNIDTEVRISYYTDDNSTDELSYETIGIISNGKNGENGTAPSCKNAKIIGYSLNGNEDINDNSKWVSSLNELGSLSAGQPIYILNEYEWSDGSKTKGITATLSGTQGVAGKSRVLFYLGSFKDGTLKGTSVKGTLNDERCDYYIDSNDIAWMRTGDEGEKDGSSSGNLNDSNWKVSTKVGFLQAGAIHADMINTKSLMTDTAFISGLEAIDITAENLKVNAAKIQGKLTAEQIATGVIPEGLDRNDVTQIIGETEIDGGKIRTDSITASQIAAHTITANEIEIGLIPDDLDIDWLKNAFSDGSTTISNGLILSSFIAVNGNNGPESGLNSSTKIKSGRDDYDDKKLVFFAGSNGLKTSAGGSTNISSGSTSGYTSNAKIEFFSDGSGYVAGDRFKWDETGKATVQNLIIKNSILDGSFRSPFKQVETSWGGSWSEGNYNPDTQEIYDNLYCDYGGYYLPWTWTNDNIGRHITLVNNRGGNKITDYGTNHIDAEDGYYFFEDGVARKRLNFSNEILDLIGYGNDDKFYGWIVNKRDNIMTMGKYGHNLKCLCFGTVTFSSSSSASIDSLKTFDGTSTSTSYHISQRFSIVSDTNSCTITMPQCWFRDAASDSLHVVLTPVYNTRIPQVALGTISGNSFKVHVDKCPASFNFMLYNKNDWMSFYNEFAYKKIVYVEKTTSYSGASLSYIKGDTDTSLKFKTNASNGLKIEYVEGDNGWVYWELRQSGGEYTLYLLTTDKNTQDERQCKIKITYNSLSNNETTSSSVTHSHTILLTQQSMYTDNGGGGGGGYGS